MLYRNPSYGWSLYLRDLNEKLQKIEIEEIKKHRPDLVDALDKGEDILVGLTFNIKDYKVE